MTCRRIAAAVFLGAFLVAAGICQTADTASSPLTNESILKLAKAGSSVEVMIEMVENQPGDYKVDADSVVALKKGGVHQKVISAMILHASRAAQSQSSGVQGSSDVYSYTDGIIYSDGVGMTPPSVIHKVRPEYSDQARAARLTGTVTLSLVVNTDGKIDGIRVLKGLGMGLDEKAIEAIQKWRFKPGLDRKRAPVRVRVTVELNFVM